MKSIIFISVLLLILVVSTQLIGTNNTGYDFSNLNCSGISITYFYQPGCSHCVKMEPLINELSKSCSINIINAREQPEIALSYGISATPTMIVNNERLVGEFTAEQVKDLINQ